MQSLFLTGKATEDDGRTVRFRGDLTIRYFVAKIVEYLIT